MATQKSRAGRSPSYPDLNLEEAIEKARVLWERENRNYAPVRTVVEHWEFKGLTGPAVRAVAALKKFGLLEDKGHGDNRQARLTELGQSIILDERADSQDRKAAIRTAALLPGIHETLWEQYQGNLPSDSTLRYVLQKELKFSPKGADALIEEFRATIAFAELEDSDSIAEPEDNQTSDIGNQNGDVPIDLFATSPKPFGERSVDIDAKPTSTRLLQVPLLGGNWAAVQLPQPMSEPEWDQMMKVLNAMKPGIVSGTTGTTPTPVLDAD